MSQLLKLIHSECGGDLELDRSMMPLLSDGEGCSTDIYQGVMCMKCHKPLGILANIDEVPYAVYR